MLRFLRFINRPLPGWLVLMLFAAIPLGATTVLPFFASGTASFGPGGVVDLGSVDASGVVASADPGIWQGSGTNLAMEVPNNGVFNFFHCTNVSCSATQKSLNFSVTNANYLVPVAGIPSGGLATTGPFPPCYSPSGLSCNTESHAVHGTLTATVTGVCGNNAICNLRPAGSSTGLTGNAQFIAAQVSDIDCATFSPAGYFATTGYVVSQQIGLVSFYNATGTAIPDGTGNTVGFYCWGI